MSNLKFNKNITIALNDAIEVIWTSESSSFSEGDFTTKCSEANTIFIGQNVTYISGGAFEGHEKVRSIYVYNDTTYTSVYNYFQSRNMKNASNEEVEVTLLEDFNPSAKDWSYDKDLFINVGEYIYVADFGAKGKGNNDTDAINRAIEFVVYNGGKLLFSGNETYTITSPIMICPPKKTQLGRKLRDFEIDFNGCEIKVLHNENSRIFYVPEGLPDTMIYVNAGYPEEERIGVISNLNLNPGYYNVSSTKKVSCIENGMYLHASSHISYKNIEIKDATTGVYIHHDPESPNNIEVFMDGIRILKSQVNGECPLELSVTEAQSFKENGFLSEEKIEEIDGNTIIKPECKHVGIDCRTTDSHFSDIKVQDYLIGMRILGADNRICDSRIGHKYCTTQRNYAVGYINGSQSYYNNCEVDDFYIGWMSQSAVPNFLTDCTMVGSKAIPSTADKYAFYICPSNYSGGGIYTGNCDIVSSAFDVNDDSLLFSNIRKKHPEDNNREVDASDIHTNVDKNSLSLDIADMQEYDSSAVHTCALENNSTFNQYGRIKTINKEISNSDGNRFNVFRLTEKDFNFGESQNSVEFGGTGGYIDNVVSLSGKKGTIITSYSTQSVVNKGIDADDDVTITVKSNEYFTGDNYIEIDLTNLGYEDDDIGCISFDYYTKVEDASNSEVKQTKCLKAFNDYKLEDYFTGGNIELIPLEESAVDDTDFKSVSCMFKIKKGDKGYFFFEIGHRNIKNGNENVTFIKNKNPIIIKNLRVIKIPNNCKFPKYYLETEDNYKKRLLNTFANRRYNLSVNEDKEAEKITFPKYIDARALYDGCSDSELTFVSFPYKHTVSDNTEDSKTGGYKLSYSTSGKPSFKGLLRNTFDGKINPEIYVKYNSNGNKKYFVVAGCEDPLYDNNVLDNSKFVVEKFKIEDNGNLVDNYIGEVCNGAMDKVYLSLYDSAFYSELELTEDDSELTNKIILPLFKISKANENVTDAVPEDIVEVPYALSNFIVNPYGYYSEPLVDEDDNAEDGVDIPLYADGEVRLMVKDMQYSTDLPTVFYQVKYEETQDIATDE